MEETLDNFIDTFKEYLKTSNIEKIYKIMANDEHYRREYINNASKWIAEAGINIYDYVENIPPFFYCDNQELIQFTVPPTVKEIGEFAFSECEYLETVIISEGVEKIKYRAFESCSALSDVYIPSTINFIDNGAFDYCQNIILHVNMSEEKWKSSHLYIYSKANIKLSFEGMDE